MRIKKESGRTSFKPIGLKRSQGVMAGIRSSLMRLGLLGVLTAAALGLGEGAIAPKQRIAHAQTTPSITLDGTTNTAVTPLSANPNDGYAITGGTLRGNNLYHSFDTFSPESGRALFNLTAPAYDDVTNVLSRVTGSDSTVIDGILDVLGGSSPSLFLLNPNGIVIGTGASLYIPGTFFATTGHSFSFTDGSTFSTQETSVPPILSVSTPIGIQFGNSPGSISSRGAYTATNITPWGTGMTLLGSGIDLQNTLLSIPSGHVQLGSVAANTQVSIDTDTQSLVYSPDTSFENISIDYSSLLVDSWWDGTGVGSGRLALQGKEIVVDTATLSSINRGSQSGGSINLIASEQIDINRGLLSAYVYEEFEPTGNPSNPYNVLPSTGRGANISIETDRLTIGPSNLTTDTFSHGDGGDINIRANEVSLVGASARTPIGEGVSLTISASSFGSGDGGNISIEAQKLQASGSTLVASSTHSAPNSIQQAGVQSGRGGDIALTVGSLTLKDGAQVATTSFSDADAGNLTVRGTEVFLSDSLDASDLSSFLQTQLTTSAYDEGSGGLLSIDVESLSASGAALIASASIPVRRTEGLQHGDGGGIEITSGTVRLEDGADITTSTYTNGASGDIKIDADDVFLAGYAVDSALAGTNYTQISASTYGGGQGGNVTINAERFSASGESGVLSSTLPLLEPNAVSGITQSNSGNLAFDVGSLLVQDGAQISARTEAAGHAGSIQIESDRLQVLNGGQITASTSGSGNAGSINILSDISEVSGRLSDGSSSSEISSSSTSAEFNAGSVALEGDIIRIQDGGTVSVSSLAGGSAGNVSLSANDVYLSNGTVRAEATAGDQGNLSINSQNLLLLRQESRLTTNATGDATGGNIVLNAPLIVGIENSDISANATEGNGGNIRLVTQGLIGLKFRDRLTAESDITASSELGVNGSVSIESPTTETDSGLVELPENLSDASSQVIAGCAAQTGNQFVSSGRGGLPMNPLQSTLSNRPWQDIRPQYLSPTTISAPIAESSDDDVVLLSEAGQWQRNSAGEIELVASQSVEHLASNCAKQSVAGA